MKDVVIVSAVRTAMGSFGGSLSGLSATDLGAAAIKGALSKINLDADKIEEVYMGNVLQANVGQAPARQAAIKAGLNNATPSTTVNKVCASGMKAVMMAAQAIKAGDRDIVVAGGMESMSNAPYYLPKARNGYRFGDGKIIDGLTQDGLTDVYNKVVMGVCAETCATDMKITREDQDNIAVESYKRSAAAWEAGKFDNEVVPVEVPQRRGEPVVFSKDEEYINFNEDKFRKLRTVFKKDGTVTAGNASTINDGASALVLMSAEKAAELGLKPLAKITSYADAAHDPEWFTTAPAKALPIALEKAGLTKDDIAYWELNEAFAVVGLANMEILGIKPENVNVNGGAVSLGHPLGNSGSRILVTLINVLEQNNAKYGAAGICNGGGGASAMILERL
ncbi:MAG: acetyl-CoA C-acyltransferase [Flavobacteriales bacterium]|jgi:acetyl-CoA C-acetyltransferase|nr:acetyl-CoA C-acyltransferase [Flavobacteriales bacterium]